jgi:hypothetical protein
MMGDAATAFVTGAFSLATAFGTIILQDHLSRRRTTPSTEPPARPISEPPPPSRRATRRRLPPSLLIGLVGLLSGLLNVWQAEALFSSSAGLFIILGPVVICLAFMVLFRRRSPKRGNILGFAIDCATLWASFIAGILFSIGIDSKDDLELGMVVGAVVFIAIWALSFIIGTIAIKLFAR